MDSGMHTWIDSKEEGGKYWRQRMQRHTRLGSWRGGECRHSVNRDGDRRGSISSSSGGGIARERILNSSQKVHIRALF